MLNQLKTIVLLGAPGALIVAVGTAFAPGQVYLFVALAVVMNAAAYFFSNRAVLAMHGARDPPMAERVRRLLAMAGYAVPPSPRLRRVA